MSNKKISELPYIDETKISGNTLVPLVTYFSAVTGDTVHTFVSDLQNYLVNGITGSTIGGDYLPLSGGTVTGSTIFTNGLTTNTISATTYQNLPVSGLTAGSNINISGSNGNFTISVTGVTGGTFTGGTVTGPTTFTSGLSANTLSINGINITGDTFVTGGTYSSGGTIVLHYNNGGDSSSITGLTEDLNAAIAGLAETDEKTITLNYTTNKIELKEIVAETTGGTRTFQGNVNISGGTFSSEIISATTYQNLPISGLTAGNNINISGSNGNFTISVTGLTTGSTTTIGGDYLPLSGGTVTGETIFTSGVTINYIDFNTTPTVPNPTGGTIYFDSNENALSYKPITDQNDVTVNLGQESLIRIYNDLPTTILNGQVLHITGATSGIPTVALANASKLGTAFTESLAQTSGVATHDIDPGDFGFMTNFGIVRDLNTSAFTVGSEVFLSDTVDGALTNDPNSIEFTSRISTVGYCLESHPTTGKILVVISNENPLQSLTQQEVNVLLGNTISTGAYFYTGATTASTTTINVSPMRGWIVYNTGPTYATNPLVLNIYYSGGTNLPVSGLTSSFDTYLLVNSGGTLYQTNTYPTPQERRQNIFLGRVVHPNKTTILNVEQSVDYEVSPLSSLRDLWVPIKLINEGVVPSPNGATLTFKTSSGTFWGNGIGFPTDELNPNAITVPGYLPASFYYTTQTGGTFTSTTTTVDTTKYDVGGVITNVPGSGNYTTQRIYMSQSGVIRLQYGQNYYSTLAKAIAAIPSETFVVNPDNSIDCTLIGLLTVKDGTGNLSNTDDAIFTFVSKFGEILGGTGGISTTTLQQAYDNSVNPEIITNPTLGGVQIRGGTGNDNDNNFIIENNVGSQTAWITASGNSFFNSVSANTISATTLDIRANDNLSTSTSLRIRNNANTSNYLVVNNAGDVYNNGNAGVTSNTFFGENVGRNTTTGGTFNSAFGSNSLQLNTSGSSNSAFGYFSLASNTTGNQNSAFGVSSLQSNISGYSNSSFGLNSLYSNTIGFNNSAFGAFSLQNNISGSSNSAFGRSSLTSNTSGASNSAFGINSLLSNTSGSSNTAIGSSSMQSNIGGGNNTAVGVGSLQVNTYGNSNAAFGVYSLSNNTASNNSAFGYGSSQNNTIGFSNSSFGYLSSHNNTVGFYNSAFGELSQFSNTSGYSNSSFGYGSLRNNTVGYDNSTFGIFSLFNNTSGNTNSAFGRYSLYSNTTGNNNSAFGSNSLYLNTTGQNNIAFGESAGFRIQDGNGLTASTNSIFIGVDTRASGNNQTNQIVIGHNAIGLGSNTTVIGNSSTTLFRPYGNVLVDGTLSATTVSATTTQTNTLIIQNPYVPTGSTDPTGTVGTISWSGNTIYLRNSTEWVRFTGETSW